MPSPIFTSPDTVNHPCTGNAIKYLWRWKQKNGVEDLRKAKWYISRLIENLGGE